MISLHHVKLFRLRSRGSLYLIFYVCVFGLIYTCPIMIKGQVRVQPLNGLVFQTTNCWNVQIESLQDQPQQIYLKADLEDTKGEVCFSAESVPFALPPYTTLNPQSLGIVTRKSQQIDSLSGRYRLCISAYLSETGQILGNGCEQVQIGLNNSKTKENLPQPLD